MDRMKKILAVFAPLIIGLLVVTVVLAGASSLSLEETSLVPIPAGEAYEVNLGSDGFLYVSDNKAIQIWRMDPNDPQADVDIYRLGALGVSDARPDSTGDVWFTDGATGYARFNPSTSQGKSWTVPELHNLGSLTFDSSGKLWMAEYFGSVSKIYSFAPLSSELCTYTLPEDGSLSDYILYNQDQLWFANHKFQMIYNLDISEDPVQATWWQIPYADSLPVGIALDSLGNLWWADSGLGALAKLDPQTNIMTHYDLPNASKPKMLTVQNNAVWYTAWYSPTSAAAPGYFGELLPQNAIGTSVGLDKYSSPISRKCNNWGPGSNLTVVHTTAPTEWSPGDVTDLINTSAWHVYQLPSNSDPWGITFANDQMWMVDQGRQKLMRFPFIVGAIKAYLPTVLR